MANRQSPLMMDSDWWIAGYDIRTLMGTLGGNGALSVDPCIWPSILEDICAERGCLGIYGQLGNWVSLLPSMEALLGLVAVYPDFGTVIEISFPKQAQATLAGFLGAFAPPVIETAYPDRVKRLIGFDAVDPRTLTSAIHLTNNGKTLFEPIGLAANGLFKNLWDAEQACQLASTLIPSHAPFFPAQLKVLDVNFGACQ